MVTLEIKNITKTYKKGSVKALDDFTAALTPGVYGLLGPNGAGKSTLMNIITDNLTADSGEVLFDGENIKSLGASYRAILGYMPQQQGVYDDFTLNRFLWYMAALKGMKKAAAKEKITQLLDTVNLTEDAHKKLGSFSGGMKQRALIAQALLNDPKERIRIRNFISEMAGDKIVLISTHVVSDIEFIAKEIILLSGGKLVAMDTARSLTETLSGKVFEIDIAGGELDDVRRRYRISNIFHSDDKITVRIVTDIAPDKYACREVTPTLEDLYLYVFEEGHNH